MWAKLDQDEASREPPSSRLQAPSSRLEAPSSSGASLKQRKFAGAQLARRPFMKSYKYKHKRLKNNPTFPKWQEKREEEEEEEEEDTLHCDSSSPIAINQQLARRGLAEGEGSQFWLLFSNSNSSSHLTRAGRTSAPRGRLAISDNRGPPNGRFTVYNKATFRAKPPDLVGAKIGLVIALLVQLLAVCLWESASVSAFCPSKCQCDDLKLSANCTQSGPSLTIVPMTLNPLLKSLTLNQLQLVELSNSLSVYRQLEYLNLNGNQLRQIRYSNFNFKSAPHSISVPQRIGSHSIGMGNNNPAERQASAGSLAKLNEQHEHFARTIKSSIEKSLSSQLASHERPSNSDLNSDSPDGQLLAMDKQQQMGADFFGSNLLELHLAENKIEQLGELLVQPRETSLGSARESLSSLSPETSSSSRWSWFSEDEQQQGSTFEQRNWQAEEEVTVFGVGGSKVANFEQRPEAKASRKVKSFELERSSPFLSLGQLRVLDLSGNKLARVNEHAFLGLIRLKELDLSRNRLQFLDKHALVGLVELRRLDLSRNQLLDQHHLGHLSLVFCRAPLIELEELSLSDNSYKQPHFSSQFAPNSLDQFLQARHQAELVNQTSDTSDRTRHILPNGMFICTPRVRNLQLASMRLRHIQLNALENLNNLQVLNLSSNPLEQVPADLVMHHKQQQQAQMPHLRAGPSLGSTLLELDLSNTLIEFIALKSSNSFNQLHSLRVLRLNQMARLVSFDLAALVSVGETHQRTTVTVTNTAIASSSSKAEVEPEVEAWAARPRRSSGELVAGSNERLERLYLSENPRLQSLHSSLAADSSGQPASSLGRRISFKRLALIELSGSVALREFPSPRHMIALAETGEKPRPEGDWTPLGAPLPAIGSPPPPMRPLPLEVRLSFVTQLNCSSCQLLWLVDLMRELQTGRSLETKGASEWPKGERRLQVKIGQPEWVGCAWPMSMSLMELISMELAPNEAPLLASERLCAAPKPFQAATPQPQPPPQQARELGPLWTLGEPLATPTWRQDASFGAGSASVGEAPPRLIGQGGYTNPSAGGESREGQSGELGVGGWWWFGSSGSSGSSGGELQFLLLAGLLLSCGTLLALRLAAGLLFRWRRSRAAASSKAASWSPSLTGSSAIVSPSSTASSSERSRSAARSVVVLGADGRLALERLAGPRGLLGGASGESKEGGLVARLVGSEGANCRPIWTNLTPGPQSAGAPSGATAAGGALQWPHRVQWPVLRAKVEKNGQEPAGGNLFSRIGARLGAAGAALTPGRPAVVNGEHLAEGAPNYGQSAAEWRWENVYESAAELGAGRRADNELYANCRPPASPKHSGQQQAQLDSYTYSHSQAHPQALSQAQAQLELKLQLQAIDSQPDARRRPQARPLPAVGEPQTVSGRAAELRQLAARRQLEPMGHLGASQLGELRGELASSADIQQRRDTSTSGAASTCQRTAAPPAAQSASGRAQLRPHFLQVLETGDSLERSQQEEGRLTSCADRNNILWTGRADELGEDEARLEGLQADPKERRAALQMAATYVTLDGPIKQQMRANDSEHWAAGRRQSGATLLTSSPESNKEKKDKFKLPSSGPASSAVGLSLSESCGQESGHSPSNWACSDQPQRSPKAETSAPRERDIEIETVTRSGKACGATSAKMEPNRSDVTSWLAGGVEQGRRGTVCGEQGLLAGNWGAQEEAPRDAEAPVVMVAPSSEGGQKAGRSHGSFAAAEQEEEARAVQVELAAGHANHSRTIYAHSALGLEAKNEQNGQNERNEGHQFDRNNYLIINGLPMGQGQSCASSAGRELAASQADAQTVPADARGSPSKAPSGTRAVSGAQGEERPPFDWAASQRPDWTGPELLRRQVDRSGGIIINGRGDDCPADCLPPEDWENHGRSAVEPETRGKVSSDDLAMVQKGGHHASSQRARGGRQLAGTEASGEQEQWALRSKTVARGSSSSRGRWSSGRAGKSGTREEIYSNQFYYCKTGNNSDHLV